MDAPCLDRRLMESAFLRLAQQFLLSLTGEEVVAHH